MMMKCPKCHFQQPEDRFCAKCGINVEAYTVPKTTLFESSQKFGKILIILATIVLLGLGLAKITNKSMRNQEGLFDELDLNESTQIGVGAQSLGGPARKEKNVLAVAVQQNESEPDDSRVNIAATDATATAVKSREAIVEAKYNQVEATISLIEHLRAESGEKQKLKNGFWFKAEQNNPIARFADEEILLKVGANTFEFDDELIKYDLEINIEEITEKNIKTKIEMKRLMKTQTDTNRQTDATVGGDFTIGQYLIIEDALPRRARIDRPGSILSTLYKSQLFLSSASELVLSIKFENPTNAPQE